MEASYKDVVIDKRLFDQTYPLLDKFKTLAPGTFKHSQNVVNMCETVAIELDLNVELIKVAALYHDCGKMNDPLYFAENQTEDNIHDKLDPYMSYQVITRHVGDSVIHLLQIPNLPYEVVNIVSQHHGDTVLQSFANKDKKALIDTYRYKCSPPVSAEALILMLCDAIEATTRALYNSDNKDAGFILKSVNDTVKRLVEDHQLDNMKIGILNITKKILIKELESIYHKRVTYESDESDIIGDKKNKIK